MMVLEERPSSNGQGKGMKVSQGPMSKSKTGFYLCKNDNDALWACIWGNGRQSSEREWPGKVPLTFLFLLFLMTYPHSGKSNLATPFSKITESKNNSNHILFRNNSAFSSLLYIMWDQSQKFARTFIQRHYLIGNFPKCIKNQNFLWLCTLL